MFEATNAWMRRPAPMTAKSKEKKRAAKVRRAMGGTGGRGKGQPMFREGERAFMYLIESGNKSE